MTSGAATAAATVTSACVLSSTTTRAIDVACTTCRGASSPNVGWIVPATSAETNGASAFS